jgi:hypothetical protein
MYMNPNNYTDKHTVHSYIEVYEELFKDKKETATDVLEIGVLRGGSLCMWNEYFTKANICGFDIDLKQQRCPINISQRILLKEGDAYDKNEVPKKEFDIIIDDGSHQFIDMLKILFYYIPLLKDDGILVIEDIPHLQWTEVFTFIVKEKYPELKDCIIVKDLRYIKNRFDDMLFIIDKRKTLEK